MKKILYVFTIISFSIFAHTINAQDYSLLLKDNIFTPESNIQNFNKTFLEEELVNSYYYRIIQFESIPKRTVQSQLKKLGIELLDYVPNKAYVASIHKSFPLNEFSKNGIRSVIEIPNSLKIHQNLIERPLGEHAVKGEYVEIIIQFYKNLDHETVLNLCRKEQIVVLAQNNHNNFLRARIPIAKIEAIAKLPFISHISIVPPENLPDDSNGRGMHRANAIDVDYLGGRNYDGTGISVQVRDDGIVGPHIDFKGRLEEVSNTNGGTHGDGVGGILAGAGNRNPRFKGMASGATLYNTEYTADFLDTTLLLHLNNNVLVTNSSYSNFCNGGYTSITKTVDQQTFENPTYMHVFSAGNSNSFDCDYGAGNQWGNITGGHKQGKNVIATANLDVFSNLMPSSSRGPASDGRIKPDISAHGAEHVSTFPDNGYFNFGGTSAASPGIAGIFAMLHNAYQHLNDGEIAEAALIKACLLNTANDRGNVGPDFKFGWGQVNALRAVRTLEEGRYFNAEIEQDLQNVHDIIIPAGVAQAKIMVYWSDNDALAFTNKALVNDLDTEMTNDQGNIYQPWILNPAPNPTTLDEPATKGEDHLNNVEQISITNPLAGTYSLSVEGFEIPFGVVKYYVVYDFLYGNDIEVIYPIGGEGLVPGEFERIHWDATSGSSSNFLLEYSIDNGVNWLQIDTAPTNSRQYTWTVPNEISGQCLVRISRDGNSSVSNEVFTIADVPQNIEVITACPSELTITWDSVAGATNYEVFLLGDKYMEVIDTTDTTTSTIAISNLLEENWFAVRAIGADNLKGQRSIAQMYTTELLNCPLNRDVAIYSINSPQSENFYSCGDYNQQVSITAFNNSINDISNLQFGYQLNNGPVIIENAPVILFGESLDFTFTPELSLTETSFNSLKVWVNIEDDEFVQNDTMKLDFTLNIYEGSYGEISFIENFESGNFPPEDWQINNPDLNGEWTSENVISIGGYNSQSAVFDNYPYNNPGQRDALVMKPIEISEDIENPVLSFDVAYAYYSLELADKLTVEVSTCEGGGIDVIYSKEAGELSTVGADSSPFQPESSAEWRNEIVDLSDYKGKTIFISFVNTNGYGNALYIDNINLYNLDAPEASFLIVGDPHCTEQGVVFTSNSTLAYDHFWDFGPNADPQTSSGQGPHWVFFSEPGIENITLTVSNIAGENSMTDSLEVLESPIPDFFYSVDGNTVSFTNNSQNATSYLWDFGIDNAQSIKVNPTYTYPEIGSYAVKLTAFSDSCGDNTLNQQLQIVVNTIEVKNDYNVSILPNPNNGNFSLKLDNINTNELQVFIYDIAGKLVKQENTNPQNGYLIHDISIDAPVAGMYFVKLKSEYGERTVKVVIE